MTDDNIVEAMARAIEERRDELIHQPIARIYGELARAALSVARPMIGAQRWRTIESAPKDGSEFLAYDRRAKKFDVCVIRDRFGDLVCEAVQYDSIYGPDVDEFGYDSVNITHWTPLPTPPATGEKENG